MDGVIPLQLFRDGHWRSVGEIRAIGPGRTRFDPTHFEYDFDYVSDDIGARGVAAVSVRHPVDFQLHQLDAWPAFATDLLPQGEARRVVDGRNRATGRDVDDWNALRFGAGNPVGNLRVARAGDEGELVGLTRAQVVERGDTLYRWARDQGITMTGSTDTGGAAPKLLLTEADDGLLYPDGALPDRRARRHFIVKFPRGRTRRDAQVLANEAAYVEVARGLGLRCQEPAEHDNGALFVPRFDRTVAEGGVERAGMESVYAALGVVRPGVVLAWEDVVHGLVEWVETPETEVCELVARDAVAWALGDTDNHGRNTALLKPAGGGVALAPLFDFAPMYLDPELIKRSTRWASEGPGRSPDWQAVAAFVDGVLETGLRERLRALGAELADGVERMRAAGVDEEICQARSGSIAATAAALREV